ncbi:hypothetical protein V6Z11_D01G184300 [Gossypium hirsutum]
MKIDQINLSSPPNVFPLCWFPKCSFPSAGEIGALYPISFPHFRLSKLYFLFFVPLPQQILWNTKILTGHMRILLIQKMCMVEKVMMMTTTTMVMMTMNQTIQVVLKWN